MTLSIPSKTTFPIKKGTKAQAILAKMASHTEVGRLPSGGRVCPRWPAEVPSNCSHAVTLWPTPFSSVPLLLLHTNLSGCACAGLNGSSESWNKDTSHTDRVAPLKKTNTKVVTETQQIPKLGYLATQGRLSQVLEGLLSRSKRTVRNICLSWPLYRVMPYERG